MPAGKEIKQEQIFRCKIIYRYQNENELIKFARNYNLPLHTIESAWNASNTMDEFHRKISDILEDNRLLN